MFGSRKCRIVSLIIAACFLSISAVAKASTVKLLHSETEAYSMRLELIDSAENNVDVSSYEISDDSTSGRFLLALLKAAQRGVVVRILTDGHIGDNLLPKPLMHYLIEHGIPVRERPVNVRYQVELGRSRLHDKLLIVDRMHLITGGRNLAQKYFGIGDRKCIDCDVYVDGQSACYAADYFEQRWNESKSGQPELCRAEAPKVTALQKHPEWNAMPRTQALEQIAIWFETLAMGQIPAQDLCSSTLHYEPLEIDESQLRFMHDCVGMSKRTDGAIAPEINRLLKEARRSIEIETPYFAISKDLKSILQDAVRRGVHIRILTNSLESTDHPSVHAGFANERRWMLRAGIRIYELQGRNMLHAKSMVIDGRIAMVGSYNFDRLAESRNSEVALLVTDCQFAKQVSTSIATHRAQATELHLGDLFRYELRESNVSNSDLRRFRRLRIAAPLIERYL